MQLSSAKPEGYIFGRPTKYRPEICEQVVEWGALGKSKTWIAAKLGVCKRTVQLWEQEYPDFLAAMTRAKALEQMWWEDVGQEALGTREFQASVWSRSMAARFPDEWRESTKSDTTVTGGLSLNVVTGVPRATDGE